MSNWLGVEHQPVFFGKLIHPQNPWGFMNPVLGVIFFSAGEHAMSTPLLTMKNNTPGSSNIAIAAKWGPRIEDVYISYLKWG